jgi:hypothetical protein
MRVFDRASSSGRAFAGVVFGGAGCHRTLCLSHCSGGGGRAEGLRNGLALGHGHSTLLYPGTRVIYRGWK